MRGGGVVLGGRKDGGGGGGGGGGSALVQTGRGAQLDPYTVDTSSFPGVKRPGR